MAFNASQKISKSTVIPVANAPQLPANLTPGFYAAYESVKTKQETEKREKQKKNSSLPAKQEENDDIGLRAYPEIFELLKTYQFKEFFQLMMSGDDARIMLIVKKERFSRGIEKTVSLSDKHRQNDYYINRTGGKYRKANRLVEAKPGQSYSGTL